MGLHLEKEMAVVKTPIIISNNPIFENNQGYVVECGDPVNTMITKIF